MALRLLEVILPEASGQRARELLEGQAYLGLWHERVSDDHLLVRVLLSVEETESFLDVLEERFAHVEGFRIVLLPVEASLPRPAEPSLPETSEVGAESDEKGASRTARISREELYADMVPNTRLTGAYVAMVVFSAVVATIGMLRDNVAVIIGAMVIAPLLGPNMALCLATTLGDMDLGRRALKTISVGIAISLALAMLFGYFFDVDVTVPEVHSRTKVGLFDVALALASGGAGALACTTGFSATLIGVMVAVALLPPLVAFGLLIGAGLYGAALGALLLLMTNVICLNLAGVLTFLIQGIRPIGWWEADRAQKTTRVAIILWLVLLAAMVFVLLFFAAELA